MRTKNLTKFSIICTTKVILKHTILWSCYDSHASTENMETSKRLFCRSPSEKYTEPIYCFFSLGGSTLVEFLTFSFFKWHFLAENSNGAKSHQKLRSVLNINIIPTNSKIYERTVWTFYLSKKFTIVYNLQAIGQKSDEVTVTMYCNQDKLFVSI